MKDNPYSHLDPKAHRVAYLIAGYIRQTITEAEHDELDDWVNENDQNMKLFEDLTDETNLQQNLEWMDKVSARAAFEKDRDAGKFNTSPKTRRIHPRWMIAASVVLLAGLLAWLQWGRTAQSGGAGTDDQVTTLKPGGGAVTLTSGNDPAINIVTAKQGAILTDSGLVVRKLSDGTLQFSATGDKAETQILQTGSGGNITVQLPDGSRIWLNALTKLSFPSRFTGGTREVELDGEAYFEIAPDKANPFRVKSANQVVEVVGTHFNVNTYPDEPASTTTLLEGAVNISSAAYMKKLVPGQQASVTSNGIAVSAVEANNAIAWKNHVFKFNDAPVEVVMRQISRWYGAEIKFQDNVAAHFKATVDRSESIEELLHYLERTGQVHFEIKDKTIIVKK